MLPILAVIGRPNVGKSTLVNRILGKREAVVEDIPGVTRDRVMYSANWAGYDFTLMDTGGWDSKAEGLEEQVSLAAELAIEISDVLVFVVDTRVGVQLQDEQLLKLIRKSNKPCILVGNKVDNEQEELDSMELWNLGLGEPAFVSALHGRGSGDLLDRVVSELKKADLNKTNLASLDNSDEEADIYNPIRSVALVGKPNVGKSSLLNQLAGDKRVVVSDVAGTTRDPVDEMIEIDGQLYRFIDTAGIRKKSDKSSGAEYYALLRTEAAIYRAELVLVVIDVTEMISEQDLRIINLAIEAKKAIVLVFNKWDTLAEKFDTEGRRELLEEEIERDLNFVTWAPRVNLSAKTGWHKNRLQEAMETALLSWDKRIPTSTVNAFIGRLIAEFPHPVRGGKQPRIKFASQVDSRPPKFLLFATGFLEHQYRRFIERKLREEFGFEGTPIVVSVRVQEKRK